MTKMRNMQPAVTECDAKEAAPDIVRGLRDRFQVDEEADDSDRALIDQHLSSLGHPTVLSMGATGERVEFHPRIAEALRAADDWCDALVSVLRYAGNPTAVVSSVSERRQRLRRFFNALNHAMGLHPDLAELDVRDDLAHLGLALDGLDFGQTRPLLRTPAGVGNRPPDTRASQQFRVYVATFYLILERAGEKRKDAFSWVAGRLTEAGATSLKGKAKGSIGFSAETVKKYFYGAMPGADDARRASEKKSGSDRAALNLEPLPTSMKRDGDTMLVAQLVAQFVLRAEKEAESLPPRLQFAQRVIRETIKDPAFSELIP